MYVQQLPEPVRSQGFFSRTAMLERDLTIGRVSVCLLRAGIEWKLITVRSCGFHRRVALGSFFETNLHTLGAGGNTPNEGFKWERGGENADFLPVNRYKIS